MNPLNDARQLFANYLEAIKFKIRFRNKPHYLNLSSYESENRRVLDSILQTQGDKNAKEFLANKYNHAYFMSIKDVVFDPLTVYDLEESPYDIEQIPRAMYSTPDFMQPEDMSSRYQEAEDVRLDMFNPLFNLVSRTYRPQSVGNPRASVLMASSVPPAPLTSKSSKNPGAVGGLDPTIMSVRSACSILDAYYNIVVKNYPGKDANVLRAITEAKISMREFEMHANAQAASNSVGSILLKTYDLINKLIS